MSFWRLLALAGWLIGQPPGFQPVNAERSLLGLGKRASAIFAPVLAKSATLRIPQKLPRTTKTARPFQGKFPLRSNFAARSLAASGRS
jgi:hypothetical protein